MAYNYSLQIPEGWVLDTRDGNEIKGFYCPQTGQQFKTYNQLMRYVTYAKAMKLSIYAEDSNGNKLFKGASSLSGKNSSSGQGSNSSMTENGTKSTDPVGCTGSTQKPDPNLAKPSSSKAKKKRSKR